PRAAAAEPTAGRPPAPQLVYLSKSGTFIGSGATYTLDLGAVQYGETLPTLQFGIENAAAAPADQLSGTVKVDPVEGFTVSGTSLPSPLGAGQSYDGITATINTIKFGQNTETITFSPVETKASGFSAPLGHHNMTSAT